MIKRIIGTLIILMLGALGYWATSQTDQDEAVTYPAGLTGGSVFRGRP